MILFCYSLALTSCGHKEARTSTASIPAAKQAIPSRIFAPYFATWLPESNFFQVEQISGIKYFSLAFVESKSNACVPIWSNNKTVAEDTEISGELTALRKQGGDAIVSFGGAEGHELGQVCKDPVRLQAAYQEVIDKLSLHMVDFDIETSAIRDPGSVDRRNIALAALEKANPALKLSFTLEVLPSGLTPESLDLLKNAIQHNVRVDMVNILAMDYGPPADPNLMGQNAVDAATHTLDQLKAINLDVQLGITAMLGKNDVSPEVFAQSDAQALLAFAHNNPKVRMLSMWSVQRDQPCPAGGKVVAGTCSGIEQQPYEFAHIFLKFE
jgi:hypothetical protein